MHMGQNIDKVLKQKGMTQKAMAKKIGEFLNCKPPSSQSTHVWIKTGQVDEKWHPAIAEVLGVSIQWLKSKTDSVSMESSSQWTQSGIPVEVAKQAAIQAHTAAQAVGGLDAEQFARMFLAFCKVDLPVTTHPLSAQTIGNSPQPVQTIQGSHLSNNTQMGNISIGQLKET